eukprot:TRINITY_DN25870_c0_g1_i1.p1 TRINITY_DN25870_c0_g1~~TRINITY_DN25870_c0_g1_i1.p1  ORF type:complete len:238 (-),score=29.67 TRINITY_DN25870_c0_g1_i1:65-685(-)
MDDINARADREGRNMFGDFVYNLQEQEPDIVQEGGGIANTANGWKLPVFRKVGFSAAWVKLDKDAMVAPHWIANAAAIHYVTRGQGRFEMVYPDGKQAIRLDVKEGDLIVIPNGYPHATIASGNGMEYISFMTRSRPQIGFLAGGNSVYRMLPRAIQQAAFNVDEKLLERLHATRQSECYLLAPRGKQAKAVEFNILNLNYAWMGF